METQATQAIQGTVVQMNTMKGSQFAKLERKDGTVFVAEFPEGEHRSFNLGPLPKPIFGMQKQPKQFKTKDGLVDHYLFVGEQPRETNEVYVKSEKTSDGGDVRTDIPETVTKADVDSLDPYLKIVEMSLTLQIETDQLRGITDEMEIDDIITSGCCRIIASAKRIKKLFENEK